MLRLMAIHDAFSGIEDKSVDNLRRILSRTSIWFSGIRMRLPDSSSSENRLFTSSLSPPPLTPPTRGGEYSLFPCIPPPGPLPEGENVLPLSPSGGGERGGFRWGRTVTVFICAIRFFMIVLQVSI